MYSFSFFLKVKGINLLKVHAADEFAYGRMLLDTLFTRAELKESLVYKSKLSEKPGLDTKKVELLLSSNLNTNTILSQLHCMVLLMPPMMYSI